MKIILNSKGTIAVDIEDYNQEEVALMLKRFFYNNGVCKIELCQEREKLNPINVIEQLRKDKPESMITFGDEYMSYIEVLEEQVFKPNGYKLLVEKII